MLTLIESILSENPKAQIYCDMDGVLVDFVGGICALDGNASCSEREFDAYIRTRRKRFDRDHPRLFLNFPWMADGKILWNYISQYGAHVLSAHTTSWQPTSKEDKMTWIKREMRPLPVRIHIGLRSEKREYAVQKDGTKNILIDDLKQNIDEWNAAGGVGIHHKNAATTIATLKRFGFTGRKAMVTA